MSEALPPGTHIGNYRIDGVLGHGGMGVVYLAEHVHLGRRAALKTISGVYAQDAQFRERFVRESRVAARIDHPHIVPIYDAGEDQGRLYLAMRLVDGEDLDDVIRERAPVDTPLALEVCSQVASALDAAHAEGLVHRDVKPANVLLERSGGGVHAYLVDFGLTKRAGAESGLTAPGQVMGTPFYVAPEQIDGKDIDGRADQYSLGCVLYECLTGSPPFAPDGELLAILSAHAHHPRPRVTDQRGDLPTAVDDVVARALATRPEARYATCGELVTALRTALGRAGPPVGDDAGAPAAAPAASPAPDTAAGSSPAPQTLAPGGDGGAAAASAPDPATAGDAPPSGGPAPPGGDGPAGEPPPPGASTSAAGDARRVRWRSPRTLALLSATVLLAVVIAGALAVALTGPGGDGGGQDVAAGDGGGGAGQGDEDGQDGGGGDGGGGGGATPAGPPEPSGRVLFTSDRSGDNDIHIIQPDGTELANLTEGSDADDRQARWSPDRDRVVFASDRSGRFAIHTMNPDGSDVTRVTSGEGRDLHPVFSRDGQRIAFSSQRGGTRSIFVVDADGTGPQRVTGDGGADSRPAWSPDGQLVAFHRDDGDVVDIFVHNVDAGPDGSPVNVTSREARDVHPSWSSQLQGESQLVFATNHIGNRNVVTLDVIDVITNADSDAVPVAVTDDPAADFDPVWSADDQWIAFESDRDGNSEIYLVRPDGSRLRRLTDDPATDADPGW